MPNLKPVRSGFDRPVLPDWFRQELPNQETWKVRQMLFGLGVRTVCQEARCPNLTSCFNNHEATFMILGDTCTRSCCFCAVKKSAGKILSLDRGEGHKIVDALKLLKLKYLVITSVTRDDLKDGGSSVFAQTIKLIKSEDQDILVEVLVPDFNNNPESIAEVVAARPDCFAHNLETVNRLYKALRPQADYRRSLNLLNTAKKIDPDIITKSSLMLGLGETEEELLRAMEDLRKNNCDILTLGQYLSPSAQHYPVQRFLSIAEFDQYRARGISLGFKAVLSKTLARSSYQAEETFQEAAGCMI